TQDMARLVNDLLLLAQARRNRSNLVLEAQDLTEVVNSLRAQLGTERIECQSAGERVVAHRPYLLLILRNLLENALHYSEPDSPVRVSWSRGEIVVSDQGVGLSEEACARVFEPFWRADRARARHAGGAGLGLAIAHSLAEAMDGHLSVTSQPGRGSQFRLRLPLARS
ncbi:MAG: sensor histidine kinase, partial [Candidatus Eremiobacteraeota bacterium]|nr:sensor histidine kinase [Candidatus Eremiobacteraeota bacterium]